jgi:hypothetical protein
MLTIKQRIRNILTLQMKALWRLVARAFARIVEVLNLTETSKLSWLERTGKHLTNNLIAPEPSTVFKIIK